MNLEEDDQWNRVIFPHLRLNKTIVDFFLSRVVFSSARQFRNDARSSDFQKQELGFPPCARAGIVFLKKFLKNPNRLRLNFVGRSIIESRLWQRAAQAALEEAHPYRRHKSLKNQPSHMNETLPGVMIEGKEGD